MNKNKTKRLSITLPLTVHDNIRRRADIRHITITRWVLRCIIEKIIREENEGK